jgi:hypothetical protein
VLRGVLASTAPRVAGALLVLKDRWSRTALAYALMGLHLEAFEVLCSYGASLSEVSAGRRVHNRLLGWSPAILVALRALLSFLSRPDPDAACRARTEAGAAVVEMALLQHRAIACDLCGLDDGQSALEMLASVELAVVTTSADLCDLTSWVRGVWQSISRPDSAGGGGGGEGGGGGSCSSVDFEVEASNLGHIDGEEEEEGSRTDEDKCRSMHASQASEHVHANQASKRRSMHASQASEHVRVCAWRVVKRFVELLLPGVCVCVCCGKQSVAVNFLGRGKSTILRTRSLYFDCTRDGVYMSTLEASALNPTGAIEREGYEVGTQRVLRLACQSGNVVVAATLLCLALDRSDACKGSALALQPETGSRALQEVSHHGVEQRCGLVSSGQELAGNRRGVVEDAEKMIEEFLRTGELSLVGGGKPQLGSATSVSSEEAQAWGSIERQSESKRERERERDRERDRDVGVSKSATIRRAVDLARGTDSLMHTLPPQGDADK